eukprot:COSAG06_NODE_157_length_21766_cov_172.214335_2_plen_167_part_00
MSARVSVACRKSFHAGAGGGGGGGGGGRATPRSSSIIIHPPSVVPLTPGSSHQRGHQETWCTLPLIARDNTTVIVRADSQAEWAANALTDAEWESFQRDGYLRLPPVPPALIGRASAAAHQLVAEKASSGDGRTKITGLIGREVPDGEAFMDLVDCPTTFPKGMSR